MAFKFTDAGRYPYRDGGFFLGADDQGREVGISTERHLLTIAGAGAGKGAALIIPNLKRWKGSALVVDPKGENATLTAEDRAAMGQTVGIVDPFHIVKGPASRFRVSINPLAVLDPAARSYRKDIEAVADGMIMRHDPKHETWVKAARTMIGGGIDMMLAEDGPPEEKTLPALRRMFLQPPAVLRAWAESMLAADTPARLAPEAGALLLEKLDSPDSIPAQTYGSNLLPALGWIGDPAFDDLWHGLPPFDLRKLKEGNATLYLVLPPDALGPRGTFLRLFVSMTLNVMMSDLAGKDDARCLFMLDEFYSLGSLDIVAQAMGLMRGYGVQLWPFMQDLGQLLKLYGDHLSETFFGNADAHIFFGNTDSKTLDYISRQIGVVTQADIGAMPPTQTPLYVHPDRAAAAYDPLRPPTPISSPIRNTGKAGSLGQIAAVSGFAVNAGLAAAHHLRTVEQSRERQAIEREERAHAAKDQNAMRDYQDKMARKGEPHLKPSEIRDLVAKHDGDLVARSMIVVAKGSDFLNLRLVPYFAPTPSPLPEKPLPPEVEKAWKDIDACLTLFETSQYSYEKKLNKAVFWGAALFFFSGNVVAYFQQLWIGFIVGAIIGVIVWYYKKNQAREHYEFSVNFYNRKVKAAKPIVDAWEAENGPIKGL